jgi:hypothetical protein
LFEDSLSSSKNAKGLSSTGAVSKVAVPAGDGVSF